MSELRQDMFTGEWVIFAANRGKRPYDFIKKEVQRKKNRECPFCPNHEELTPKPVYQNGEDGNWNIRVFPNMYPAVSPEFEDVDSEGFYTCFSGNGVHEVLVDTPCHGEGIQDFSHTHITKVLQVIKDRQKALAEIEGIRYVQIFKNTGPDAGASIDHSHWQIMGIPVLPRNQMLAFEAGKKYLEETGHCIYCDMIHHELQCQKRVIAENEYFVAFTPYASKLSYEVWIAAKEHIPSLMLMDEERLLAFSELFSHIVFCIRGIFEGICYNICFQDMPVNGVGKEHFHWYARLVPRIGNFAGFEFATGSYINPILPETAAEYYRKVKR